MKKEGTQNMQEISKQYGLDKYEKNEFTQAIFKEFRKYGSKLIKIAAYEDMQSKGKPISQEIQELLSKKTFFQNHLTSLKFALDTYAVKSVPANVQKEVPKVDLEEEKKLLKQGILDELSEKIALLFKVGFLLENESKCSIKHDIITKLGNNTVRAGLLQVFKSVASIKDGEEISLKEEINNSKSIIQKLVQESKEVILDNKVSFFDISKFLLEIRGNIPEVSFSIGKKAEPLLPPGLFPQAKKETQAIGVNTTEQKKNEEGYLPPEPYQRLPVSVLVGNFLAVPEKKEQPEEIDKIIGPAPGLVKPNLEEKLIEKSKSQEEGEVERNLPSARRRYYKRYQEEGSRRYNRYVRKRGRAEY